MTMEHHAPVHVFMRPNCPHCARAEATLAAAGLAHAVHDVTASRRAADASVYLSGAATVPQIFLGDRHIQGADDLAALAAAGRLAALAAAATGALDLTGPTDEELARGAEDWVLRRAIPESDGTHDPDPETWPILRFYRQIFGFWPNCFYFMHHWPEAYKLFVYCHNFGAIGLGREVLGVPALAAVAYATSNAHGCNYCRIHATISGGLMGLDVVQQFQAASGGGDGPIGPFERALAELAADATRNTVRPEQPAELAALVGARDSKHGAEASLMATAMVAAAFGMLNVFNDLTGVEVEAEWAHQVKAQTGLDAGRHGVSEYRASTNLSHALPKGGPDLGDMVAKYEGLVAAGGGPEVYAARELGLVPGWIRAWPAALRARHVMLYTELMQDRPHSPIPAELKHLMARVSAVARGHDGLAAVEGLLAYHSGGRSERAVARVRHAFDAARGRGARSLFDERECAALTLAWLSARTPLVTPRRFVAPAIEAFTPVELVHLCVVCGVAGLVQRFAAIARPALEPEVRAFLDAHGLAVDSLAIRYPLAEP